MRPLQNRMACCAAREGAGSSMGGQRRDRGAIRRHPGRQLKSAIRALQSSKLRGVGTRWLAYAPKSCLASPARTPGLRTCRP